VEFRALDGAGVDLFLGLAGPVQERREYLSALGKISYFLRSSSVREDLRRVASPDEVRRLVRRLSAQEGPVA
jgi:mannitol/fructose-specific phosphotransferase system IIA component (Ntr-type)